MAQPLRRCLRFLRACLRDLTCGESDPWFAALLLLSFGLCVYHLSWGLPNGNFSWAADALGPLSVLGIAKRSLGSFNSGWFWYKYPFGYPLLLLVVYAPYLGWLAITGRFSDPSTTYPYGFADPEAAMYTMAMIGRWLNVGLIVGTVAVTYGTARRLLDRPTALLSAWFIATAYPILFYAHTTNQDAAYMFWLMFALWATTVAVESDESRPYVLVGFAAAMAMATKEQGFALLGALAVLIGVARYRAQVGYHRPWRRAIDALWSRPIAMGLLATLVTTLIAQNALINPMGVVNRILDLTGHPIPGMSARLTPIEFALFKGFAKETWYIRQLVDASESTFGLPLLLCVVGGIVYLIRARPRAACYLLIPAAGYYFVSLRVHDLLGLRYALPLFPIFAIAAGALCAAAVRWRHWVVLAVVALAALSLARGVELLVLLHTDSRYQAELWFAANAVPGSTVEYYQKPVYVPRFAGFDAKSIPLDERTIAGVKTREPDYIVLSSAGRKSITHFWNPTWTEGGLLLERPEARALLEAIEGEQLGYELVAHFDQQPRLLRVRITSLCPKIEVYRRRPPPSP